MAITEQQKIERRLAIRERRAQGFAILAALHSIQAALGGTRPYMGEPADDSTNPVIQAQRAEWEAEVLPLVVFEPKGVLHTQISGAVTRMSSAVTATAMLFPPAKVSHYMALEAQISATSIPHSFAEMTGMLVVSDALRAQVGALYDAPQTVDKIYQPAIDETKAAVLPKWDAARSQASDIAAYFAPAD